MSWLALAATNSTATAIITQLPRLKRDSSTAPNIQQMRYDTVTGPILTSAGALLGPILPPVL